MMMDSMATVVIGLFIYYNTRKKYQYMVKMKVQNKKMMMHIGIGFVLAMIVHHFINRYRKEKYTQEAAVKDLMGFLDDTLNEAESA
jgi:prefoldin subunit 5